ncbi:uncharacterized protein NECHADRAFT_79518 [Fusarium vanettenii 77-13-4]|uniref:Uncharacterized protein n=1 Tax=Fusarium vanettenii (strain ATCC MYA-4622 / CBS 123669 / FGSC 9596 / NRRL 45880 / 77-13-4) TaxID=660122 RepID=C7Z7Q2_FUSV7|nr:uncharacterized protein NECHADRAFT_79518 [Fusarium vanettenii 77-13-4]EEU39867.1 predicted protein [Fusarium vanettenii 77-13-4]
MNFSSMDFNNMNFETDDFGITPEDLERYRQWQTMLQQHNDSWNIGPNSPFAAPLPIDPALERNVMMRHAMNNPVAAPHVQQNIQPAPVAVQEPIAQGIQNNVGSEIVFPAFEPVHLDTNQLANIASADLAKIEQAADSDHNTDIASYDEDDVDAEGEPADFQDSIGLFPNPVPMSSENVAAIAHLSTLPPDQLAQVIVDLQNQLRLRENDMMSGEEMDIDQPEQIDGIPTFADAALSGLNNIQNNQVQSQVDQTANNSRPDIRSFPRPDGTRASKDRYLLDRRADGYTYKEIKEAGGFSEAEPTLRGRWRTLTKDPQHRLRSPTWKYNDIVLLRKVTYDWFTANKLTPESGVRPPWKILAQQMFDRGASYHFGSGTISKKFADVYAADQEARRRGITFA